MGVWIITAAVALLLYGLTMAPGVLWGDSGEAQLRVLTGSLRGHRSLARSHSTYYAAACFLRTVLKMEPSRAANLTAAIAGAVTVANFGAIAARFAIHKTAVIASVCMLMFSHTLWQMSTGAEVVTFYTMLLTAELLAMLRFAQSSRPGYLVLAVLINGLSFSTHDFALLLWPAYAVVVVSAVRRGTLHRRWVGLSAAAWCLGATPILYLALNHWRESGSIVATLHSLLIGRYDDPVLNASISIRSLSRVVMMTAYNFPTPLAVTALIGWWCAAKRVPRLWLIYVACAASVVTLFAVRYDVADQYTFMVPPYILLMVFAPLGIDRLLASRARPSVCAGVVALSAMAPLVYFVTPQLVRRYAPGVIPASARRVPNRDSYDWFFQPWRCGYDGAERYARRVFDVLPEGAILIVLDTMRQPLDYLQGRDDLRRDVYLSNSAYDWPGRTRREVTRDNTDQIIRRGLLYAAAPMPEYISPWMLDERYAFIPAGPVYKVVLQD